MLVSKRRHDAIVDLYKQALAENSQLAAAKAVAETRLANALGVIKRLGHGWHADLERQCWYKRDTNGNIERVGFDSFDRQHYKLDAITEG